MAQQRVKVNADTAIYFAVHDNKWLAKWMAVSAQSTWCGFGTGNSVKGLCTGAHNTKDDAIFCALGRWACYAGKETNESAYAI